MEKNILFWFDADLTNFSLSYYLQKKINAKFFGIFDVTKKPKFFFKNQSLVKLETSWFYHDYVKLPFKKADLNYLKDIEKKYHLDLWEYVCNDRFFNLYNDYRLFSYDEILSILEQECRLYEQILQETNPNYFITPENTFRNHHLLYMMCKSKGIKILMLNIANIGNLCYLSQKRHYLDHHVSVKPKHTSFNDLQQYLKEFTISNKHQTYIKHLQSSKISLINAAIKFLTSKDLNDKSYYTYFGRTRFKVFFKEIIYRLKRKYRNSFINKNFVRTIDVNSKFVYFSLQTEPERSLLIAAPFYTNQLEMIRNFAKSLPIDYKLYVKEHPNQGPLRGWRKISEYKEILRIPNVSLIHPSFPSEQLLQSCSIVVSAGTTCFEAGFYSKPSITFADLGYTKLPHVFKIDSLENLPELIRRSLSTNVIINDVSSYLSLIEQQSFEFDYLNFILNYQNVFYHGGNLVNVDITEEQMLNFLSENENSLAKLVEAHIEKIKYFEHETPVETDLS